MIISITSDKNINGRPINSGYNIIALENREVYTYTVSNFTTETSPQYEDPEGDPLSYIKVRSLPAFGTLTINDPVLNLSRNVVLDELIYVADISSGNFRYLSDQVDNSYTDNWYFDVADTGSQTLGGFQKAYIQSNVAQIVNNPPDAVGDGSRTTAHGAAIVFSASNFTSETSPQYNDPEGDAPYKLKILDLPSSGILLYNGLNATVNQEILLSEVEAGYLVYVPDNIITSAHSVIFNFAISDVGSQEFTT